MAKNGRTYNRSLWTIQALLAALFLFAGGMKLVMPLALLAEQSPLSPYFLKFIGTAEVLGALGLILPGLLRILPVLTPVAGAGLVIIMIGATTLTAQSSPLAVAVVPMVVGLLSGTVALGRSHHTFLLPRPTES